MQKMVKNAIIEIVLGDITQQDTEAIVNAANSRLCGGSGVDGAIHKAGGPSIMEETKRKYPEGCPTGKAVITGGGNLKSKYVIHAVGPIYRGQPQDKELLRSAYLSSLRLADLHGIKSISFPSISTGAYGYPIEEASKIAVETVENYLSGETGLKLVRFVLFSEKDLEIYKRLL